MASFLSPRIDVRKIGLNYRDDLPLIQGLKPDSLNEVFVANALTKLGLDYQYKYWVGIPGTRGSMEIDFLVYTVPKITPLRVHGRYWHTGRFELNDRLQESELASMTRNQWNDPVIIWDDETETLEQAVAKLRELLMI